IPNRGFAQDDIELFGLTYLQKISDTVTGGALHIEPGIWVTQPSTTAPPESTPTGSQIVARMATIPHGNALLAQGQATLVSSLTNGTFGIAPVNTAPVGVGDPMPAGGTEGGFPPYKLTDTSPAAVNFRTPAGNTPPIPLPATINTVPMQNVINDPTRLLDQAIKGQFIERMTVIEVATVASLNGPSGPVPVALGAGGVENMPFLVTNADAAVVFATFWIETIRDQAGSFLQLQYVQTVLLNFPILGTATNLSWPHVSVATLRKTFG
ncbi:MAG: heme-binding protein, partial [Gallionella sp.]